MPDMDFTDNHGVLPVESRKTPPTSLGSCDSSGTGTVRRDPARRSAALRWDTNRPPAHQLPVTAVKPAQSGTPDTQAPRSQRHPAHGRSDSGTQISSSYSLLLPHLTRGGSLGTVNKFLNQTIVENLSA
ncbi:hypothetical protein CRENBAI_004455 [Crenichthys baileyi]|uniref:Uncharacterized protein n=1 Tax=Crenichthys baileyi TaxID=28760 RepID=A0AAV9RKP3_9TELE